MRIHPLVALSVLSADILLRIVPDLSQTQPGHPHHRSTSSSFAAQTADPVPIAVQVSDAGRVRVSIGDAMRRIVAPDETARRIVSGRAGDRVSIGDHAAPGSRVGGGLILTVVQPQAIGDGRVTVGATGRLVAGTFVTSP